VSWVEETDLIVVELGECVVHCGGAVQVKFSNGDLIVLFGPSADLPSTLWSEEYPRSD
jgi:hypothetical protein